MRLSRSRTVAAALWLAFAAVPAAAAQTQARVIATRDEVRIVYPADTAHAWGWAAPVTTGAATYAWGMMVDGVEGNRSVSLAVLRPEQYPLVFPSLQALVATARGLICPLGMVVTCADSGVSASVEDGRVTLRIDGRARVARLFGLRPAFVHVWRFTPGATLIGSTDSVRVEYLDPQIPPPGRSTLAAAERARRREEAAATTVSRSVVVVDAKGWQDGGELWMTVGDSLPLRFDETVCTYDSCVSGPMDLSDGGWSVDDSTVVGVRAAAGYAPGKTLVPWAARAYAVARRPGRTTVRVRGVHGRADRTPSSPPAPTELERVVVVTKPVARLEISPREGRAVVGDQRTVRIRAFDVDGAELTGFVPELRVEGGPNVQVFHYSPLLAVPFERVGTYTLTASFGGKTDVMTVTVAER